MGFASHCFLRKLPGGEYHLISRDWGTNQVVRKALFTCVVLYTKMQIITISQPCDEELKKNPDTE